MKKIYVKISGSYKTDNGDIIDFRDIEKYIPYIDFDVAKMHVISRLALMWLTLDENYPKRVSHVREVFVDKLKEVDEKGGEIDFDIKDKDIREMSAEELQMLAVAYDLREIPLYRSTSLRQMQSVAYSVYAQKVLEDEDVNYKEEGFNLEDYDPIKPDMELVGHRTVVENRDLQDIIDDESGSKPKKKSKKFKGSISFDELKEIADANGVKYPKSIGYNKLYEKVYGQDK